MSSIVGTRGRDAPFLVATGACMDAATRFGGICACDTQGNGESAAEVAVLCTDDEATAEEDILDGYVAMQIICDHYVNESKEGTRGLTEDSSIMCIHKTFAKNDQGGSEYASCQVSMDGKQCRGCEKATDECMDVSSDPDRDQGFIMDCGNVGDAFQTKEVLCFDGLEAAMKVWEPDTTTTIATVPVTVAPTTEPRTPGISEQSDSPSSNSDDSSVNMKLMGVLAACLFAIILLAVLIWCRISRRRERAFREKGLIKHRYTSDDQEDQERSFLSFKMSNATEESMDESQEAYGDMLYHDEEEGIANRNASTKPSRMADSDVEEDDGDSESTEEMMSYDYVREQTYATTPIESTDESVYKDTDDESAEGFRQEYVVAETVSEDDTKSFDPVMQNNRTMIPGIESEDENEQVFIHEEDDDSDEMNNGAYTSGDDLNKNETITQQSSSSEESEEEVSEESVDIANVVEHPSDKEEDLLEDSQILSVEEEIVVEDDDDQQSPTGRQSASGNESSWTEVEVSISASSSSSSSSSEDAFADGGDYKLRAWTDDEHSSQSSSSEDSSSEDSSSSSDTSSDGEEVAENLLNVLGK